jgi:hypothetical protein
MDTTWNVVLKMPVEAKGWRVTALVYSPEDELIATDEGNLMSLTGRKKLTARLADQLKVDEDKLEKFAAEIDKVWLEFYSQYQQSLAAGPAQQSAAELLEGMPVETRLDAEAMLQDPRLMHLVRNDLQSLGIAGETGLSLTLYLVGISRQLGKPLNARVHGPTSSGKSFVVETVCDCFPPETLIRATQITAQAFFHMEPGSLKHRLIVAGERSRQEDDETAEKTRALRELQASGRLSKLIALKGPGGQIVTKHIEQEGPIAFVETTSLTKVFGEDANRCLTLFTDERPEQTKTIIRTLAARYQGIVVSRETDKILQRHHALQRLLEPLPVIIPYAERLGELLDHNRVEMRRGFPQVMSMVQTIALLHQWQRERDSEGRLVAVPEDYGLARDLLLQPMMRLLGKGLSEPATRFRQRLSTWATMPFSTTAAVKKDGYTKDTIRAWLVELLDAGMVKIVSESKGRTPTVWEITQDTPAGDRNVLPTLEKVCTLDSESSHRHNT